MAREVYFIFRMKFIVYDKSFKALLVFDENMIS